jgi:hypothetical protein
MYCFSLEICNDKSIELRHLKQSSFRWFIHRKTKKKGLERTILAISHHLVIKNTIN